MTTTYKVKERYSFGWTDPRTTSLTYLSQLGSSFYKEFNTWSLEQLRNAWLVRFGSGIVNYKELLNCEDPDYIDIAILLEGNRQLETFNDPSKEYPSYRLIPCK